MKKTTKKEKLTYVVMWVIMFLAPLVSLYVHSSLTDDVEFSWEPVLHMWDGVIVLLVCFLIHNYLLAPLFIDHKKIKLYILGVLVLSGLFLLYEYDHVPPPPKPETNKSISLSGDQKNVNVIDTISSSESDLTKGKNVPPHENDLDNPPPPRKDIFPPLSPNDIMALMLLLALLATNLALKLMFRNMEENERRVDLERQSLKQELSYLKYQVNPHFLMNTLNNIHAMVDIDPEKAKSGIVKLSQLLRYMLYEGSKTTIPLDRGIMFMRCYIDLMSVRFDNVDVKFEVPDPIPNVEVLPLLVITFLENAFKHGVSYVEPSFIHVSIDVKDNHLLFNCVNSKHNNKKSQDLEHAGFGIANAKKRLDLIFGDNYDFEIDDSADTYKVWLSFPLDVVKELN